MGFLPRSYYQPIAALLVFLALTGASRAQNIAPKNESTRIRSVRVIPGTDGPAIEIISTHPLEPNISTLSNPSRLVIDLPDSLLLSRKAIDFRSDDVAGVRANQFQNAPPITRVVVDLTKPIGYSWDAAGNRLMIRLKTLQQNIAPANASGDAPKLIPVGPGSSGTLVQTASRSGDQGSSLTAGRDTAIMHLPHGGEVRVCPNSTVSVNYSPNGHDMLLAINTGALEAHYVLEAARDSVVTPDFRIQFSGPGEFDFAISADSRGNTCVRSLRGNTGSAIVSELMGDGAYRVNASEQVVFRGGQIAQRVSDIPPNCGCPESAVPELMASAATPASGTMQPDANSSNPIADPDKVHIQVDAPFVFRAIDLPVPAAPIQQVAQLSVVYHQRQYQLEVMVLPPPPPPPLIIAARPRNLGFFGKIKGFFSAIFR